MNLRGVVMLTLGAVLAVSLLTVWLVPSLQDFTASNRQWNGVKSFMRDYAAREAGPAGEISGDARKTILVSIPYLPYTDDQLAALRGFVADGGTLFLADDYGYGNLVLQHFGMAARFDGAPLLDPLFSFHNQWLPKVTDFAATLPDVKLVVLNHATALRNITPDEAIAWSSSSSFLDASGNENVESEETRGPLPVAAAIRYGGGMIVLASDPSLVINSMISREDNQAFVRHLMGLNGEKEEVLFDTSHLTATPLDVTKTGLERVRVFLGTPYPLLGMLLAVFAGASVWLGRTGGRVERQPQGS